MLDTHPRIGVPYESHLYNAIYPAFCRRQDLGDAHVRARLVREILRTEHISHWDPKPSLAETLALVRRDDFHGIVEALLSAWIYRQGKARWGEKTPQHTLWWRTILAGFPDLQVIHVVRDGRDVALSYRAAHFGPKHVYQLATLWVQYLKAAEAAQVALGPTNFLSVRYEDLLAQPELELRRICDFLKEEFVPEMLSYYMRDIPYPTDLRNVQALRCPLIRENTGKWRTQLSRRELRIYEALAGEYLDRYCYERSLPGASISPWEATSCQYLEHPPRRVYAMMKNRQGYRLALQDLRLKLMARWTGSSLPRQHGPETPARLSPLASSLPPEP